MCILSVFWVKLHAITEIAWGLTQKRFTGKKENFKKNPSSEGEASEGVQSKKSTRHYGKI